MGNYCKRLLSLLMVLFMVISMIPGNIFQVYAATGDAETDADLTGADLVINTAAELKAFAEAVNGGDTYSDKVVLLGADIDLAGSETNQWIPIGPSGDSGNKFRGTFDGQGHTIKNLYVKQDAAYHAAGLFGATCGTVKDLTIDGAYVESLSSGSATVNGTAVLAGSTAYGATIENVHVKNATVKGNRYVAGIVGYMDGSVSGCSVEDLTLIATPDDLTGSYDNGDKVGGIVGYCNSNAVEVSGCKLKGTVSITAYRDVAGVVGCASTGVKINNNTNSAALTITVDQITNSYGEKTANASEFVGRNTPAEATGNTQAEGASCTITEAEAASGTITPGYTRADGVWGEASANASESFSVELYVDDTKIATTQLNNIGGIIDGDVYVTWSIPFAGSFDEYWTVTWEEGYPDAAQQPTKVVLYCDGEAVAQNAVQMNGPDDLNPVVWKDVVKAATITYVAQVGEKKYESLAEAFTAAQDGDEVVILSAGAYTLSTSGKDITITGAVDGVVFDNIGARNMGGANVTFNNVTFDYYPNVNYTGLQHAGALVYNNCTINGQVFLYGTSETFNGCTFNQNSADAYNVWTYGAKQVAFEGCTFNSAGKSVLVYNEGATGTVLTAEGCVFIASVPVEGKAAIEIDSSLLKNDDVHTIVVKDSTATGFAAGSVSGNTLWNDKKDLTNLTVTVDNVKVWPLDPAGDMTYTAYGFGTSGEGEKYRENFMIDLYEVYAKESLVVELYANDTLIATSALRETDRDDETAAIARPIKGTKTVNVVVAGRLAGSWDTVWHVAPSVAYIPDTVKVYADGILVDTFENAFEADDQAAYAALPGVEKAAAVYHTDGTVTYYGELNAALTAAQEGETVMILAGEYDAFSVNKAITVVGETDAEGNNLVNLNGKLSVTGTGVTVKNLNVNNSSERAVYVSGGGILIEGCNLTGKHGLRYCYANNGNVTLKDCVITGSTYGVHFDAGNGEGNVIIDGCTITGWTSFGSAIESVTITDTEFCDGNHDVLRFYQSATLEGCTFSPATTIDFGKNEVRADLNNCSVSDGSALTDVVYLGDIANMGIQVYEDGELIVVEAKIDDTYYLTLEEAVAAARDGETVTVLEDVSVADSLLIESDITLDLGGKTVSAAESLTNKPVIRVLADVTVTGGTVDGTTGINSYAFIVGNSGTAGTLNIADGTYKGVTSAVSITNGTANITGGTFSAAHDGEGTDYGAQYLLNCMDAAYKAGTAVYNITGGTFLGFNPENNAAEGAKTDFVTAEGYGVIYDGSKYTVAETPELPTATITMHTADSLVSGNAPKLTFAMNFLADEATEEQLDYYGNWYADFVLTVNKKATFNADSVTADGYLAGQYDNYNTGWLAVPFEDVTLEAGQSLKIMEYAAELMGQSGLKFTYEMVYDFVKDFDCGIYFTPEFLAANPDLVVTLQLKMYNNADETVSEGISQLYTFTTPVAVIESEDKAVYFDTVDAALAAAQTGETVILLTDVSTDSMLMVMDGITLDLNGNTLQVNNYLMAIFSDSYVIDSSEDNSGLLAISLDKLRMLDTNPMLPIAVDGGYRFVEVELHQYWSSRWGDFEFYFDSVDQLLLDQYAAGRTSEDMNISIQIEAVWDGGSQLFDFDESVVSAYIENWDVNSLYLNIKGTENVTGLKYKARVVFGAGTMAEVVIALDDYVDHVYG